MGDEEKPVSLPIEQYFGSFETHANIAYIFSILSTTRKITCGNGHYRGSWIRVITQNHPIPPHNTPYHPIPPHTTLYHPYTIPIPSPYHSHTTQGIPIPSPYHPHTIPIPPHTTPYHPIPSLYHPYTIPIPSPYHSHTTQGIPIPSPYHPIPPHTIPIPFHISIQTCGYIDFHPYYAMILFLKVSKCNKPKKHKQKLSAKADLS